MSDGASLHMKADESMRTIIGGGEDPAPMSDDEFEEMIRTALIPTSKDDAFSYDGCSNAAARIVLEAYEKYPELQMMTDTQEYLKLANGESDFDNFYSINTTLSDVMWKLYDKDSDEYKYVLSEMTGFMWGWAVNAARTILGLGSLPNPALMTISLKGLKGEDDG